MSQSARSSPLRVYTCSRLVEEHDDWRSRGALDLEKTVGRAVRKEYGLGLCVYVVDDHQVLRKTHTKQAIVDDAKFRVAKDQAAKFAVDYFTVVHRKTWGESSASWRLDISRDLAAVLETCSATLSERELKRARDRVDLRRAKLLRFKGEDRSALVREDASAPCDGLLLEDLFFAPRREARARDRDETARVVADADRPPRAPFARGQTPFVPGSLVEARYRGVDWYPAVVASVDWLSADELASRLPLRGPHAAARAVFGVRFDTGFENGLFVEDLRAASAGKRHRAQTERFEVNQNLGMVDKPPPPQKKKRPPPPPVAAQKPKPKPTKKAKRAPSDDASSLSSAKDELLEIEANARDDVVAPAWREKGPDWRRSVASAKSAKALLRLAIAFERDAWRDSCKFALWRGDPAATAARARGACPGMTRDEWTARAKKLLAFKTLDVRDVQESLRELDYYSSDGATIASTSTDDRASASSPPSRRRVVDLRKVTDSDASALFGLLPARQQALESLSEMAFPPVGAPVLVARDGADDIRRAAFESSSSGDVVLKRGPPEKRLAVVKGVRACVTIAAAATGDDAVTVKRDPRDTLDLRVLDDSDDRVALRGQCSAFAKVSLPKFEVLGAYGGRLFTTDAFKRERGKSILGLVEHERYSYDLVVHRDDGAGPDALVVDPWPGRTEACHGSVLMAINDCRLNPFESNKGANRFNCEFVEVHVRGFPYLFVVTSAPVDAGQELLIDYGAAYWDARRSIEHYLVPFRNAHAPEDLERLSTALERAAHGAE